MCLRVCVLSVLVCVIVRECVCVCVCVCVCAGVHVYIFPYMGWLRLVGSLKLHVSFAEYCLFHRALLQKRPITLRSLLIVATP